MTSRSTTVPALVALALCLAAGTAVTGAPPTARAERSILITVLDKNGVAVRDLSVKDVTVREDGARREVTDVRLSDDRLFLTVLVDNAKRPAGEMSSVGDLRKGLGALVTGVLEVAPDTKISISELAGAAVPRVEFTSDPGTLDTYVARVFEAQRPGAVMLEGIVDAAKVLKMKPGPRRAILAVMLGSPEASTVLPRDVAATVRAAGVSFWAVSIEPPLDSTNAQVVGQTEDPTLAAARAQILASLPKVSGGLRMSGVTPTALEAMCRKMAAALTAQYVVTYATPASTVPASIQPSSSRGPTVLMSPWVQ